MAAGLFACAAANAQPGTKLKPDETVLLYSGSLTENADPVTGKKVTSANFRMTEPNGLEGAENIPSSGNIGNINKEARFDLYFPKKSNGQMVIVCPGGGYSIVSSYNEGVYVADWMLRQGITVCVVKYRLPNGHHEVPLTDVQNAFRYCRSHASEWGIRQIGVMGFSAGGHLAASASNLFTDAVTRPDFSVLIYPVISFDMSITHKGTRKNLTGDAPDDILADHYSLDKQVTANTPQTFIVHCTDDNVVPVENSIRYYRSLVENSVPAEMHIFPYGGHGWGFSAEKFVGKGNDRFAPLRPEYETALSRWLKSVRE